MSAIVALAGVVAGSATAGTFEFLIPLNSKLLGISISMTFTATNDDSACCVVGFQALNASQIFASGARASALAAVRAHAQLIATEGMYYSSSNIFQPCFGKALAAGTKVTASIAQGSGSSCNADVILYLEQ